MRVFPFLDMTQALVQAVRSSLLPQSQSSALPVTTPLLTAQQNIQLSVKKRREEEVGGGRESQLTVDNKDKAFTDFCTGLPFNLYVMWPPPQCDRLPFQRLTSQGFRQAKNNTDYRKS